jgi:hypothetical protein
MKQLISTTLILFVSILAIKTIIAPLLLQTPLFLAFNYAVKTATLYAFVISSIFHYQAYIIGFQKIVSLLNISYVKQVKFSRN